MKLFIYMGQLLQVQLSQFVCLCVRVYSRLHHTWYRWQHHQSAQEVVVSLNSVCHVLLVCVACLHVQHVCSCMHVLMVHCRQSTLP